MCVVAADQPAASPASRLGTAARQRLALDALSGRPISALAQEHLVSRKFVYQQLGRARQGLDLAFDPPDEPDDLLSWLPVTKPWLRQLVLALVLTCHGPYRGVRELLADLFDHPLSIGSVHNILGQAVAKAEPINQRQDLSAVRSAALDETFQSGASSEAKRPSGNARVRRNCCAARNRGTGWNCWVTSASAKRPERQQAGPEEIVGEWHTCEDDSRGLPTVTPRPGVRDVAWSARWVPVASLGSSDVVCVDLDPAEGGAAGQVIVRWKSGAREILAAGFGEWLGRLADDLEAGRYAVDAEGFLDMK